MSKKKFILFLIIEGSPQFYKYPLTDHDGSVVALVLACMVFIWNYMIKNQKDLWCVRCFVIILVNEEKIKNWISKTL